MPVPLVRVLLLVARVRTGRRLVRARAPTRPVRIALGRVALIPA